MPSFFFLLLKHEFQCFPNYLKGVVITAQHLGQHPVQHNLHELWFEFGGLFCIWERREENIFGKA